MKSVDWSQNHKYPFASVFFHALIQSRSSVFRYGVAVVFGSALLLLSNVLDVTDNQSYWIIAFGFIITLMCSSIGGFGPGLIVAVVTSFVVDYNYLEPKAQVFNTAASFFNLFLFCFTAISVSSVVLALRNAFKKSSDALNSAQNAIKSRDHVISVVSHDLKNPLATIVLNTELLLQSQQPRKDQPFQRRIDNILQASARMKKIIQDLLDALKSDVGKLAVTLHPVAAVSLIQDAVRLFDVRAEAKGIRLDWKADENLPNVICDRDRVLQVLSNLLDNSLKFTPAGGSILISAKKKGDEVWFAVKDTGVGISKEKVNYVFERYWQTNSNSKDGLGLGLFIAKGIVKAHHGDIFIESTPGVGTEISFNLPTVEKQADKQPHAA